MLVSFFERLLLLSVLILGGRLAAILENGGHVGISSG